MTKIQASSKPLGTPIKKTHKHAIKKSVRKSLKKSLRSAAREAAMRHDEMYNVAGPSYQAVDVHIPEENEPELDRLLVIEEGRSTPRHDESVQYQREKSTYDADIDDSEDLDSFLNIRPSDADNDEYSVFTPRTTNKTSNPVASTSQKVSGYSSVVQKEYLPNISRLKVMLPMIASEDDTAEEIYQDYKDRWSKFTAEEVVQIEELGYSFEFMSDLARINARNGDFKAVISPGVDTSVPDVAKLRVPKFIYSHQPDCPAAAVAALTAMKWQYNILSDVPKSWIACAAYAVAAMGAIAIYKDNDSEVVYPDGDWILDASKIDETHMSNVVRWIKENNAFIHRIASLILASKAIWWNTNHHTGGSVAPVILKAVIDKTFKGAPNFNPNIDTVAFTHMVGHWAATLPIMTMFNKRVRPFWRVVCRSIKPILPTELLVRVNDVPAGCHKMNWCLCVFRLMANSPVVPFLSRKQKEIIARTNVVIKRIKLAPTVYHVDAYFLTGRPRIPYDDNTAPGGFAISWAQANILTSTLCKAPYFKKNKEVEYKLLPGYDAAFDVLCSVRSNMIYKEKYRAKIKAPIEKYSNMRAVVPDAEEDKKSVWNALEDQSSCEAARAVLKRFATLSGLPSQDLPETEVAKLTPQAKVKEHGTHKNNVKREN